MFADDTNLFYSHKNIESLFDMMNKELKHIGLEQTNYHWIPVKRDIHSFTNLK